MISLVRGLADADPDLVRLGVLDELHARYRLSLIRGSADAIAAGLASGAWAVTVSGAGSGLIAICDPSDADAVGVAMREVFLEVEGGDADCVGFGVEPALHGVTRVDL